MLPRLHEREAELSALEAALGDALAGRGGVIVLQGPAGIGKTSLLDTLREAAPERGLAVAAARGSELETAYAWGVARQLLEPRLRGMSPGAQHRALAGAAALVGPVLLPERAGDESPARRRRGLRRHRSGRAGARARGRPSRPRRCHAAPQWSASRP